MSEATHQFEAIHFVHSRPKVQPSGHLAQLYRNFLCIPSLGSIKDRHGSALNHGRLHPLQGSIGLTHLINSLGEEHDE